VDVALEADQVPTYAVTVTAGDAGPVIGVSGEIDLASAPYLGDALTAAIDTGQGPVVVDLAEVTFMDSTGLGVLVFAHNRLAREERQLQLRSPSARVMRVVEVSGLGQLLQIDTDGSA
jgi:anti-anti-sigma factor